MEKLLSRKELKEALSSVTGFLRDHEAYLLYRIARLLAPNSIAAEIGSWMGRSSAAIAMGMGPRGGILHTIDDHRGITGHEGDVPADYVLNCFLENIQKVGVKDYIEHHPQSSDELGPLWKTQVDLLFIDGDHRYEAVRRDIQNYADFVKAGGWIAFHDTGGPEVARAVGEWWDAKKIKPAAFAQSGTILALKIPSAAQRPLPEGRAREIRQKFFWASCEIPPKKQPIKKWITKLRQSNARKFFRAETEKLVGPE